MTETNGTEIDVSMDVEEVVALPDHPFRVPTSTETQKETGSTFESCDLARDLLERQLFAALDSSLQTTSSPDDDHAQARIVDLKRLLEGLKVASDDDSDDEFFFIPSKIYVRDCMKTIFGYFVKDRLTINANRVLLGSPGVGKSVLFFIAALEKALNGDKPVVYVRKTTSEERDYVSIFVMVRASQSSSSSNGLKVFSCRGIRKSHYDKEGGLGRMRTKVAELFGLGDYSQCVLFLDGPRHDDEKDMYAEYEYLCTSGGHPLPKNGQRELYLWLLDGWSKAEAVAAFQKLLLPGNSKTDEEQLSATEAYDVCGGGSIRDLLKYARADARGRNEIATDLKNLAVGRVKDDRAALAITATTRRKDDDDYYLGIPDRIRAMFNGKSRVPNILPKAIQIVDSATVLRCLRGRLTLDSYHDALSLGKQIRNKCGTTTVVVGIYFEEILHQWFAESPPTGVNEVFRPEEEGTTAAAGAADDGVRRELSKQGLYWMPSVPNFANIDAAVVVDRVLYVFQYKKRNNNRRGGGFDEDSFWSDFVSVVRGQVPFDRVHVYVVVMKGDAASSSSLTVKFNRDWTPQHAGRTRSSAKSFDIPCTSSRVRIDVTSPATVRKSAAAAWAAWQ